MKGISKKIFEGLLEVPLFYKEAFVFTYNLTKGYYQGGMAKNLSQTRFDADDTVRNILNFMSVYFYGLKKKDSLGYFVANHFLSKCHLSKRYESYILQISQETMAGLCNTGEKSEILNILRSLKETRISQIEGNAAFKFAPIIEYKWDEDTKIYWLYPSPKAYSFLSHQDFAPISVKLPKNGVESKREVKNNGGRPKTDLTKIKKILKKGMEGEFVVSVLEMRKALGCMNSYPSNSAFITIKFEPLCQALGVEIIERIIEGKKVVAFRLRKINN